ncbi:cysteine proteinase 3-like isoform X2 [Ipomoea triloba]|uniref:cysteine proteinase 3-like isoform X2 n=1 Tax=Ipomoea triloba TaxID=35885 RepID=UPI00125E6B72|nr:cysteine proteinase 3-like isoform X2 [Ipomoea triloba]
MAVRVSLVLYFFISAAIACAAVGQAGSSTFAGDNLIRQVVSDGGLHDEVENAILQVIGSAPRALSFARFALKYGKRYESAEEMKRRFSVFKESLKTIRSHNKRGLSYKLGVNEFADMTWDEFRTQRLGAAQNCSATSKGNITRSDVTLPPTKDWRQDGIISPVKSQGGCGACWAFSTTGALEAAYAQASGKPISLSEQQLVDCAGAFNNYGCQGGLPSYAFEYIKYNGGLDTEQSYPYAGKDGVCKFTSGTIGVQVVDSINITQGAEDELLYAVGMIRPVSVAFQAVDGFSLYKSGVYISTICGNTSMDLNHAVLAVGYGVENGVQYWLLKNSWGDQWGENGYFKMQMGKNMCGIATCASYPIVA